MRTLYKNNKGITMISLIITIVVLLILAGVSIAWFTGENGEVSRSKEVKKDYEKTIEKEQLNNAANNAMAKSPTTVLDEATLKTEIENTLHNSSKLTGSGPWIYEGQYAKYTISTIGNVQEGSPDDYGKYVNYGVDIDGDSSTLATKDWRIFYNDGNNIYLIASDYVTAPANETKPFYQTWKKVFNGAYDASYPYRAYWENVPEYQSEWTSLEKRFMYSGYDMTAHKENANTKVVSRLLNTANWTEFQNQYSDYVIGGPTLEMFVASWNQLYGAGTKANTPLYCNNTNAKGYYVGNETNPTTYYIIISSSQGYKDTLYYPYTVAVSNCHGYWLASPGAVNRYCNVMIVHCSGANVGSGDSVATALGVRPLVSLNASTKLEWNEAEQYYDLK